MNNYDARARHVLNNKLCNLVGQPLRGTYHGVPYTGTVRSERQITTRPYDIELTITVDQPLTVWGHTRQPGEDFLLCAGDLIDAAYGSTRFPTTIEGIEA